MLAKISSGKSVFGLLKYNKIKVDDEHAIILFRQKMFDSPDGKFSIKDCMDSFEPYLAKNNRTEKVVFHASLNPDSKDKLSDEELSDIAQAYMEKLGYGNQPYIVLKHSDIKREHLHIVSLRIDENGKKINDSYEVVRSMKICKELEQEFNLVPLKRGEREFEIPRPANYEDGDLKHKVSNIIKFANSNFYFQSLGEYRTLLVRLNVTVEEVKGGSLNGIIYQIIDEKGNKKGKAFKSSLFGKEAGYKSLQEHFEKSKIEIEEKNIREKLRPMIAEAMRKAGNKSDFKKLLNEKGIHVTFHENDQKRIYGVTFMNSENRVVLNGSRLGKEFSANMFHDLFNNPDRKAQIINSLPKQEKEQYNRSNQIKQENHSQNYTQGSEIGLLDNSQSDNSEYEEKAFIREHQYEEKRRQMKAKKRGRGM
ncbi:MAG: relaxase/mobilization nuclease domain-containing protein [Candidatus Azobacteroides sp.]|nr:relaxase/mobilization nuclease domain-containing protein [Candidatus Azobacteroides sp.]